MTSFNWPPGQTTLGKLAQKKYRQLWKIYTLEGAAAVRDAIQLDARVFGILFDERAKEREEDASLLAYAEQRGIPSQRVPQTLLSKISGLTTSPPIAAILAMPKPQLPTIPLAGEVVLALDRVQDPGNLGTLLRTAAFLGVREVWLSTGSVELHNPKVLRAAMSAHLALEVCEGVDLTDAFLRAKESGASIVLADADGGDAPADVKKPLVLVLGNEPQGIDPRHGELADHRVAIERRGPVDSLNVGVAGAILLDRMMR